MNYTIKQVPGDFRVEEIPSLTGGNRGEYSYFFLEKTGLNTFEAAKAVAGKLGINVKRIGWAGNKDKDAFTKQMISIRRVKKKTVEKLSLRNIKLTYLGSGDEEITLGKLAGNKFIITVRNLGSSDCEKIKRNSGLLKENGIPNYYDEQRFSRSNPETGKLILEGKFREAAEKIFETTVSAEKLKLLHKSQLLLDVHSYQSLLFNKMLGKYIKSSCSNCETLRYSRGEFIFPKNKVENRKLPVIGFGTKLTGAASELLEEEKITARNFVIRQIPQISSEGTLRDAFVKVNNFQLSSPEEDELNSGMKKIKLGFALPKGSYATVVVKALAC